jgi:cytochrome P450
MIRTRTRYPPGPKGVRLALSLLAHRAFPLGFLMELAREFGDVVHFRFGLKHAFFVRHPDAIKTVLVTKQESFHKGVGLQWAKLYLGQGLLTSEGEFHHRQRRLVQPAFHRTRLTAYGRIMSAYADEMGDTWQEGATLDVAEEMRRLTLAIVGKTLFDADVKDVAPDISESLTSIHELFPLAYRFALPLPGLLHRLPLPSNLRFRKAVKRLDEIVYRLIHERRHSSLGGEDLLSTMLLAHDEARNGQGMTDVQVRDEVMTLLLAGHETTANALTWTWYLLSQHPEVEEQLRSELVTVLGARPATVEDLPRLTYAQRVLTEAMRLYPPSFGLGRRALTDVSVGDWVIPAGSLVLLSQFVTQRDARFFPDPLRFDPDRWLAREDRTAPPEFAYFPFGGGARRCAGEQFAWMEAILVMATLARRWRLRLVPGHPVELQSLVVLRPKFGMRMRPECRRGCSP